VALALKVNPMHASSLAFVNDRKIGGRDAVAFGDDPKRVDPRYRHLVAGDDGSFSSESRKF
jgi:hypothetical protein